MANRGEVVVVDFAVAEMAKKIRPVLVVQADGYNLKMANTLVAMITTNLARGSEPTHHLIELSTPEGKASGLHHNSVVNCNTLTTVRQADIVQTLGALPQVTMVQIDRCLKAALGIP